VVPFSQSQASWDPWQIRLLEVHPPKWPAVAGVFLSYLRPAMSSWCRWLARSQYSLAGLGQARIGFRKGLVANF